MVHNICVDMDIGHFDFDLTCNTCLMPVCKGKNNHGPALVYYAIDHHIYYLDRGATDERGVNIVQFLQQQAIAVEGESRSLMIQKTYLSTSLYNTKTA